jgi:hypothetical protein
VLDAILADREPYAERYARATAIAAQLALYRGGQFLPQGLMLDFDVQRYTQPPQDYSALGAAALEQVVMDQLAQHGVDGALEDPPDRLTLSRLGALFGAVLVTESVDVGASGAAQAEAALAAHGPFVALVREGSFVAMLRSADAERAILRQLVRQGAG